MSSLAKERSPPADLPPEIRGALRRFRWRVLRLRAGWRLGATTASAACLLGAALALDRFLLLGDGARVAITTAVIGVTAILVAWSLLGILRPIGQLELARGLEAEDPRLAEGLISSVEIVQASERDSLGLSPGLTTALFETTATKLSSIDISSVLDSRRSRLAVAAAALSWGALFACAALDVVGSRMLVARFRHPSSDLPRPSTVALEVWPGTIRIAKGDDVDVSVRILRGEPHEASLLTRADDGAWALERRVFEGGSFTRRFTALRRALEYRVTAQDFESHAFRVDVRDPPAPASFQITYRFPEYTGFAAETVTRTTGDIAAIAGTRVDLEVRASEPLARAQIEMLEGERTQPLAVSGSVASIEGIDVSASKGYRLFLEGQDGVKNGGGAQYAIRSLPDKPPAIEILEPRSAETSVEESSILTLRYDARDDVGVKTVELLRKESAKSGAAELKTTPLDALASEYSLDISSFGLRPGASVTIVLRARDGLGQESLSAERALRVAFLPDPPEGTGWPRPLAELEEALAAALEDWVKLLPTPGGEGPETLAADGARAESLLAASEKSLGTMDFLRRTGEKAFEAGRAIAIPSPNRGALEGLGMMLRRIADEDCAAFWGEAAAVAGGIRTAASGTKEPVPSSQLYAVHRAAGSHIDGALGELRAIERAERMEDAVERCTAVERGLRLTLLDPERGKDFGRETVSIAAELTKLARSSGAIDESLDAIARSLLESAAPAIERRTEGAVEAVASVRARLAERYEKDEKLAATARDRLEPKSSAGAAIEKLARGAALAEALSLARSIILALSEELELVEGREYADLDSSADLSALRDLTEMIAEEDLALPEKPSSETSSPSRAEGLLEAYRATAPSRAVGRVIQEVDRIAGGEEDLAWKLRGARTWNWRTLRQLGRTQREIERALASARGLLALQVSELAQPDPALRDTLEAALKAFDGATGAMFEGRKLLAVDPVSEVSIAEASTAAGRAAAKLDGITQGLEALRTSAMPRAIAARIWLRAQLGTIPERIARQAAAERAHAARVKDLSTAADAPDSALRAASLLLAHEEIRRETEALASKTRKEGDRLLAAGAGVERLRAYDRAAVLLAAIASADLAEASRALRATGSADATARAGMLLEASIQEEKTADKLDAVALALTTIEADETLRASSKDIEGALSSTQPADAAATPSQDPEKIAKDARICLDASLRAAETLAPRVARDPRKAPLLEILRAAAERFRQAIDLAEKKESAAAAVALAAGRARLEEAVALGRKLRGESDGDLASAIKSLESNAEDDPRAGEKKEISRELEAAYAELEKIIEAEKLEKEIAARLDDLLREEKPDPTQVEELEKKERDLEQGLGEKHLTTAELVELVSKLVAIDRDGRDVSATERTLAAEAEKTLRAEADGQAGLARLEGRQTEAIHRARALAKDFQTAGFKLSAVLPNVLRAWWKAGDSVNPFMAAMEGAAMEIASRIAPQRALLDSAAKLDAFLAGVGEMRRQALEAIADEERGGASPNSAQMSLERARRSLSDAARLRREGDNEAARRMRQSSLKSIADAAGALRSHIVQLALPTGEEGFLMSRVLDEEAARLGLGWQVLTRGTSHSGADRLDKPGAREIPFPPRFREWVRVYLRAIEK